MRHLHEAHRTGADCLFLLDCGVGSLPPWAMVLFLFAGLGLASDIRLAPPHSHAYHMAICKCDWIPWRKLLEADIIAAT